MFYEIVNNIVAINDTRLQETRLKSDSTSDIHYFHIPFCRILYRQKTLFTRTVREWNSLPSDTLSVGAQLTCHYI